MSIIYFLFQKQDMRGPEVFLILWVISAYSFEELKMCFEKEK